MYYKTVRYLEFKISQRNTVVTLNPRWKHGPCAVDVMPVLLAGCPVETQRLNYFTTVKKSQKRYERSW